MAPEIANELAQLAKSIEHPSVRLIAPADFHLTLVPPWDAASIPQAIERLRQVASRFGAFWLTFEHVGYGPQPRRPRLLWAECAAGEEIAGLRAALLEAFGQRDERPFQPHVTVARIREIGFAIARRHPIDRQLSLRQRVETVEFFQSPPPGGSGYQVLASLRLMKLRQKNLRRLSLVGRRDGLRAHPLFLLDRQEARLEHHRCPDLRPIELGEIPTPFVSYPANQPGQ
jgi:2'-5' RNA ligase